MLIGRIVKSNSHVDYVCHIYGAGEVPEPPSPEDYAFGRFVRIAVGREGQGDRQSTLDSPVLQNSPQTHIVGVIYNTQLVNPDYGAGGPRLSPERELEFFAPDYLNERAVLVGIVALGSWRLGPAGESVPDHGVPPVAPVVGAEVETMDALEVARFHQRPNGPPGMPAVLCGYLPRLTALSSPVIPDLVQRILADLEPYFSGQARVLALLQNNLAWKTRVEGIR
jgi:hypothetical protein